MTTGVVKEASFGATGTPPSPQGHDNVPTDLVLGGVGRVKRGKDFGSEVLEILFGLVEDDQLLGGQTMFESMSLPTARPSGVRGPVLFEELRRFAAICFSEAMCVPFGLMC